jgi:hypothetical protein
MIVARFSHLDLSRGDHQAGKVFLYLHDPTRTAPVPAGGFVRRIARTPQYDGVKKDESEPAVIGLFGTAPVQFELGTRASRVGVSSDRWQPRNARR